MTYTLYRAAEPEAGPKAGREAVRRPGGRRSGGRAGGGPEAGSDQDPAVLPVGSRPLTSRGPEQVPRATPRVDHRLPAGVDLPAQVRDVQLDHVGLPAEVVRPDPVEDLSLAEHPPRIAHQVAQQLELGRRE